MIQINEHEESQVSLLLSDDQISLVLEHALMLEDALEDRLKNATEQGKKREIVLSVYDLEDLEGHVAATANHCDDRKIQSKLDTILKQINKVQLKSLNKLN